MILNQAQAEAIYSAMCALNNVGAKLQANRTYTDGSGFGVNTIHENKICVRTFDAEGQTVDSEVYDDQAAFAAAYRLD